MGLNEKYYLSIAIRKEVANETEGKTILELVNSRMADQPDLDIKGQVGVRFVEEPEVIP